MRKLQEALEKMDFSFERSCTQDQILLEYQGLYGNHPLMCPSVPKPSIVALRNHHIHCRLWEPPLYWSHPYWQRPLLPKDSGSWGFHDHKHLKQKDTLQWLCILPLGAMLLHMGVTMFYQWYNKSTLYIRKQNATCDFTTAIIYAVFWDWPSNVSGYM